MNRISKFLFSIFLPLFIGGFSGYLTSGAINNWYVTLQKPFFNPPNWIFGPVWTLLYLLMGISIYRIWTLPSSPERKNSIQIFILQIVLNFFWSLIFFRWNSIGLALVEILILWFSIFIMIQRFRKLDIYAAYMNIPYLLWVSFATLLNAAYFFLNCL